MRELIAAIHLVVEVVCIQLLFSSCAHSPAVSKPTDPTQPASICMTAPDDLVVYDGSCGDLVTPEGWSCSICSDSACVTTGFTYCVDYAMACDDPRCTHRKARK